MMDKASIHNRPNTPLLMGFVDDYYHTKPFSLMNRRLWLSASLAVVSACLFLASAASQADANTQVIQTDLTLPDLRALNNSERRSLAVENGIDPDAVRFFNQNDSGIFLTLNNGARINFQQRPNQVDIEFRDSDLIGTGTNNVIQNFGTNFNAELQQIDSPSRNTLIATFTPVSVNPLQPTPAIIETLPTNTTPSPAGGLDQSPTPQLRGDISNPNLPNNELIATDGNTVNQVSTPGSNAVEQVNNAQNMRAMDIPIPVNTPPTQPAFEPGRVFDQMVPVIADRAAVQGTSINQAIIGQQENNITNAVTSLNLGSLQATPSLPFNARVADVNEINESDSVRSQSISANQIAYIDVNAISHQDTNLFATIGTGIGLKLGQCEEFEGCAPNLDEAELDELEQDIRAQLAQLEVQAKEGASERLKRTKQSLLFKINAINTHREQLEAYRAQELENQIAMQALSEPDVIPEATRPSQQTAKSADTLIDEFDLSQFDTSIFDDYYQEIDDDR